MKSVKLLSPARMVEMWQTCLQRFPMVAAFAIALTVWLLIVCWADDSQWSERLKPVMTYYLLTGGVLSLSLSLWSEEVKSRMVTRFTATVLHVLLAVDALYLYHLPEAGFDVELILTHASCLFALVVSVFFGSFFRAHDDLPAYNFAQRLTVTALTAIGIGSVMWGGLALLFCSFKALFGWNVPREVFGTLATLCMQLLPMLLVVALMPAAEVKHDPKCYHSALLHKVVRYLFLPLLGCYLVVLYTYLAKIVVSWQLPDGWVSGLVSTLMAGFIAIEIMIYQGRTADCECTFEQRVARWFPLLIIPLLMLMTVGIVRRFADYGLTLRRLYLLTLNVWFYGVCLGLFVCRARRIHWIPLSMAVVVMLTGALPVNYASLTHNYLYKKVSETLSATYHGALPMNEAAYFEWLESLPTDEALAVNSRLHQLDDLFRDGRVAEWIGEHANFWGAKQHLNALQADAGRAESADSTATDLPGYVGIHCRGTHTLPAGWLTERLWLINDADIRQALPSPPTDTLHLALPTSDGIGVDSVHISIADLKKWDCLTHPAPQRLRCSRAEATFVLTDCHLYFQPEAVSGNLSGYYYLAPTDTKPRQ